MFSCLARDALADAAAFAAAFPHTHLAGMPCGGEIGPRFRTVPCEDGHTRATQVGEVALQGFTAVFGLFSVPVRTRAPTDVFYDDVGAAYTHDTAANKKTQR